MSLIKETNMEAVKKGAKTLLDVKIRKRAGSGKEILIDHPFYGDILQPCRDSNGEKQHLNILESPENLAKARAVKSEIIDEAEDIILRNLCYMLHGVFNPCFTLDIIKSTQPH